MSANEKIRTCFKLAGKIDIFEPEPSHFPLEIYTAIHPLYNELVAQGFTSYVKHKNFIRVCNSLEVAGEYAGAMEKSVDAARKAYFGMYFDGMENLETFLAEFLNLLYIKKGEGFSDIIASLLIEDLQSAARIIVIEDIIKDLEVLGLSEKKKQQLLDAYRNYSNNYSLKASLLLSDLTAQATNGTADQATYEVLRNSFISNNLLKPHLPHFLLEFDSLYFFRKFMQSIGGYAERRAYIHEHFQPLLKMVQSSKNDDHIAQAITIDSAYVKITWQKAMDRMTNDPEGAITIARTLIETVCKHILENGGQEYEDGAEIAVLYKQTSNMLNLSPDQHT